ncbi:MAG TPA: hypothetical protein VHE13_15165 [Opitutus sp.]|nr:hypothetical protein [Opitutus sp.]
MDEAVRCREEGGKRVLVFNLSGNGLLDLAANDTYLSGRMHEANENGGSRTKRLADWDGSPSRCECNPAKAAWRTPRRGIPTRRLADRLRRKMR